MNSAVAINRILTATKPTTNSSTTTGNAVVGSSINYFKIKAYSTGTTVTALYVFGWNWVAELNAFAPQLLATLTPTFATATQDQSMLGLGTVFEMTNFITTTGDAKIFSGPTTTTNGAFALVDTMGCEFIEFCATTSAGFSNTVTILYAGL